LPKLSEPEIEQRLQEIPWRREGEAIVREWAFEDFARALAFINRVGKAAETANHHPDILLHGWNKVALTLFTHSQGGLTQADFDLAHEIEALA
jgi:4a-hydroxytetrahydrobiopterin dehydratase